MSSEAETGEAEKNLYSGGTIFTLREQARSTPWLAFGMLVAVIMLTCFIHHLLHFVIKRIKRHPHAQKVVHHVYTELLLLGILSLVLEFMSALLRHSEELHHLFEWAHNLVFLFAILFAFVVGLLLLRMKLSIAWKDQYRMEGLMKCFEAHPLDYHDQLIAALHKDRNFLFWLAHYLFLLNTFDQMPHLPANRLEFVQYLRLFQKNIVTKILSHHYLQWLTIIGLSLVFVVRPYWFEEEDDTRNFLVLFCLIFTVPIVPFFIVWADLRFWKNKKCGRLYRSNLANVPKPARLLPGAPFKTAWHVYHSILPEKIRENPWLTDDFLLGKVYLQVVYNILAFCMISLIWILCYIGIHSYTVWHHVRWGPTLLLVAWIVPAALFIGLVPLAMKQLAILMSLREESFDLTYVQEVADMQGLSSYYDAVDNGDTPAAQQQPNNATTAADDPSQYQTVAATASITYNPYSQSQQLHNRNIPNSNQNHATYAPNETYWYNGGYGYAPSANYADGYGAAATTDATAYYGKVFGPFQAFPAPPNPYSSQHNTAANHIQTQDYNTQHGYHQQQQYQAQPPDAEDTRHNNPLHYRAERWGDKIEEKFKTPDNTGRGDEGQFDWHHIMVGDEATHGDDITGDLLAQRQQRVAHNLGENLHELAHQHHH